MLTSLTSLFFRLFILPIWKECKSRWLQDLLVLFLHHSFVLLLNTHTHTQTNLGIIPNTYSPSPVSLISIPKYPQVLSSSPMDPFLLCERYHFCPELQDPLTSPYNLPPPTMHWRNQSHFYFLQSSLIMTSLVKISVSSPWDNFYKMACRQGEYITCSSEWDTLVSIKENY